MKFDAYRSEKLSDGFGNRLLLLFLRGNETVVADYHTQLADHYELSTVTRNRLSWHSDNCQSVTTY